MTWSVQEGDLLKKVGMFTRYSKLKESLNSWNTAQKIKFSIKDFFSKCDQIRRKLRLWSHLLKKSLKENFIFCAVVMLKSPNNIKFLDVSKYMEGF